MGKVQWNVWRSSQLCMVYKGSTNCSNRESFGLFRTTCWVLNFSGNWDGVNIWPTYVKLRYARFGSSISYWQLKDKDMLVPPDIYQDFANLSFMLSFACCSIFFGCWMIPWSLSYLSRTSSHKIGKKFVMLQSYLRYMLVPAEIEVY